MERGLLQGENLQQSILYKIVFLRSSSQLLEFLEQLASLGLWIYSLATKKGEKKLGREESKGQGRGTFNLTKIKPSF